MTDRSPGARALALLERVLDMEPEEREALLRHECRGDPELRASVEALLAADRSPYPLLDSGPDDLDSLLRDELSPTLPDLSSDGDGEYRLIEEVGRGGMATVYLAERKIGEVRQRVALKLVKRGIDTDDVVRRFARETRVLASLEHPHIARFYDTGVSPDGRPYLVMEFIEGGPLTRYCDAARLGVEARLALFRTICGAVQYAHEQLVVHRDIKPSNVMVTEGGDVKLLDFGIAKLLTDDADGRATQTRAEIRVLTPEYAAPEQLRGERISTATDVYALGLLLYELLAGRRPRDAMGGTAHPDAYTEPIDPPAPSTAVRRAGTDLGGTIARARSTTIDRLRRVLAGDLDRIVLKALETDPARRYRSAEQLLEDLERHRKGLPVRARPNTITYRLRKYARRHTAGLAAASTLAIIAAGFTQFYTSRITTERDRARIEANRAQTTTVFLQRLLGDAYPSVALGDTFSMGDLLRRATVRIDSLAGEPDLQAELLRTIGDIYREQGRFQDALPLLERAVALHRSGATPGGRPMGRALDALGHLQYEAKNLPAASAAHSAALSLYERILAPDDSLVLFAMNNLATAVADLGDNEEALRLHREVIARSGRLFSDTSELIHFSRNNLGRLLDQMGHDVEAEVELREALRIRRLAYPPNHPSTALTMNNLGSLLSDLGQLDEAEQLLREAYDIFVHVYGADHHRVGLAAFSLGRVQQRLGRFDEAEANLRVTVEIDRRTYGDDHLEVGVDLRRLGSIQRDMGNCDAAVSTLSEADRIFADNGVPVAELRRLDVRVNLAACLVVLGRPGEAESTLVQSFDAGLELGEQADPREMRRTAEELANLYRSTGRGVEAERVLGRLTDNPGT